MRNSPRFESLGFQPLRRRRLAAAAAALLCSPAWAGPQGGTVVVGSARITQSGTTTLVQQDSGKAVIDWTRFAIGAQETVRFQQPGTSAVVLNRVVGGEKSVIDGALLANGQVFIVNSAGVLFTAGSRVQTAGLVASTLALDSADFLAGRYRFSAGDVAGAVVNEGRLQAAAGGYVALLAPQVRNRGEIDTPAGRTALAAGRQLTLTLGGGTALDVTVDTGALDALVDNQGAVRADGGRILLTARGADDVLSAQVNQQGLLQARTLGDLKGEIVLRAPGGQTRVGGSLDASAPEGGDGGFIETSGDHVSVLADARVSTRAAHGSTGLWSVDPDGFTIGGTDADISAALLGTLLQDNNVTLQSTRGQGSDGHLHVNEAVTWSADTALSLVATQDVIVEAAITATGDHAALRLEAGHDVSFNAPVLMSGTHAGLQIFYGGFASTGSAADGSGYHVNHLATTADGGFSATGTAVTLSGAEATLSINDTPYVLIHSLAQLAALSPAVLDADGQPTYDPYTNLLAYTPASGHFALAQDVDAGGTLFAAPVISALTGTLAGLGHAIEHLRVDTTVPNAYLQFENAGLIGSFGDDPSTSVLRDLRLVDARIDGGLSVGGLAVLNYGLIDNVGVSGRFTGTQPVGSVAAYNIGTVSNAHADVQVQALAGGTDVGGLVGANYGLINQSTVRGTIAASGIDLDDGGLTASDNIGGLAGTNYGVITDAQAAVDIQVHNSWFVGGLVGRNYAFDTDHGVISQSSASGSVTAEWTNTLNMGQGYGGLVGGNSGGTIRDSSDSGAVTVTATVETAPGVPSPIQWVGGLVGSNESNFGVGGVITGSSATGNVTGVGTTYSVGGAVGYNFDGVLDGVHASGNVTTGSTSQAVGGLVGGNEIGSIDHSSASGNVVGGEPVGGLAGYSGNSGYGSISNSTATGSVQGTGSTPGGLVGRDNGSVSNSSYHDVAAEAAAQAAAQAAAEAAAEAAAQAAAEAAAAAAQAAADAAAAQAAADAAAAAQAARAAAPAAAARAAALQASARGQADLRSQTGAAVPVPATVEGARPRGGADLAARIVVIEPPSYSATVRGIEVDGERFDLQDLRAVPPQPRP